MIGRGRIGAGAGRRTIPLNLPAPETKNPAAPGEDGGDGAVRADVILGRRERSGAKVRILRIEGAFIKNCDAMHPIQYSHFKFRTSFG